MFTLLMKVPDGKVLHCHGPLAVSIFVKAILASRNAAPVIPEFTG